VRRAHGRRNATRRRRDLDPRRLSRPGRWRLGNGRRAQISCCGLAITRFGVKAGGAEGLRDRLRRAGQPFADLAPRRAVVGSLLLDVPDDLLKLLRESARVLSQLADQPGQVRREPGQAFRSDEDQRDDEDDDEFGRAHAEELHMAILARLTLGLGPRGPGGARASMPVSLQLIAIAIDCYRTRPPSCRYSG